MTTYIIYHEVEKGTPCPDGIMAAAIAKLAYPDAKLIGDSYRHESEYGGVPLCGDLKIDGRSVLFNVGDQLVIVDFSYPAHWLHHWESLGMSITLIDHHEPKFPMLAGFSGAVLDANECGATLTWRHFFPDRPQPEILRHVRRRDIGADGYYRSDENCRDSKAITAAMSAIRHQSCPGVVSQVQACQYWLTLPAVGKESIEDLQTTGESILAEEEAIALQVASTAIPATLCGHLCGKVQTDKSTDRLTSQIGNAIARQHPEWAFAWIVSADGSGNSLRSWAADGDAFDVAAIAQQMGGGGHRSAAGFKSI